MSNILRARIWFRLVAVAGLGVLGVGCGPSTLETSSVEKLEKSLAVLREQSELKQRDRLDEALRYLVGEEAIVTSEEGEEPSHPELVLALYEPLKGMTADGIIAEAMRERLDEVQSAVTELEQAKIGSDKARAELDRFKLEKSRVYKRNRGFLEWPVIEFKAENNTDDVVWLIHFRAALMRPGYDEPWLVETFDQLVLNGLAPGDRDLWRIEPEQQDWVNLIDPHPDFRFTLEIMRLEGLGGTEIAGTEWGDIEEMRLDIYSKTLETIRSTNRLALDLPPR
ncbi:MAG: hypothetical protein OEV48_14525 [Acidobacteriota bacterium]|nr:hypothetical protein [Acidobacteriota bacterium]